MSENNEAYLDNEEGIIELTDEDGVVTRFEFVDRMEYKGSVYYALIPAEYDEEEGAAEFVVLKEAVVDDGDALVTVDDDAEYTEIGELFLQRFAELPDLEELEDDYDEDTDSAE